MNLNQAIGLILDKSYYWNAAGCEDYPYQSEELKEALATLKLFRDAFFHEVTVNEDNITPD